MDDDYLHFCRLWQAYLFMSEVQRHQRLARFLTMGTTVTNWPTIWPQVEWAFGGKDRFIEAMEYAQRT